MRLFVSYARVDISTCRQLATILKEVHEVWYDELLFGGMDWWEEIEYRLQWCDGLIYLLSPEAVQSEYCIKEFEIARKLSKRIFPVLIQAGTRLLEAVANYQVIDLSNDAGRVLPLLNALTIAERNLREGRQEINRQQLDPANSAPIETTGLRLGHKISLAIQANNQGNYERALSILYQIREDGNIPSFIQPIVERLLQEIHTNWGQVAVDTRLENDYALIMEMVLDPATRQFGIEAFQRFSREFPDYDPQGVAVLVRELTEPPIMPLEMPIDFPAPFLWCPVPSGRVQIEDARSYPFPGSAGGEFSVPQFYIAQNMMTVAQFRLFLEARDGYNNLKWWQFSAQAFEWAKHNQFQLDPHRPLDLPVVGVNWYDATAFCNWLSFRTSLELRLPTEQEWQIASQSAQFSELSLEVRSGYQARPEMYPSLWEWCFNDWQNGNCNWEGNHPRVLRQGVFGTRLQHTTQINQRIFAYPNEVLPHAGFRIVASGRVAANS